MLQRKMLGIQGYRWSRCNVARGSVSGMFVSSCASEDNAGLFLSKLALYALPSDPCPFSSKYAFSGLDLFLQGKTAAPLKRACVR